MQLAHLNAVSGSPGRDHHRRSIINQSGKFFTGRILDVFTELAYMNHGFRARSPISSEELYKLHGGATSTDTMDKERITASEVPFASRAHKKSKRGCKTCKLRKIKVCYVFGPASHYNSSRAGIAGANNFRPFATCPGRVNTLTRDLCARRNLVIVIVLIVCSAMKPILSVTIATYITKASNHAANTNRPLHRRRSRRARLILRELRTSVGRGIEREKIKMREMLAREHPRRLCHPYAQGLSDSLLSRVLRVRRCWTLFIRILQPRSWKLMSCYSIVGSLHPVLDIFSPHPCISKISVILQCLETNV